MFYIRKAVLTLALTVSSAHAQQATTVGTIVVAHGGGPVWDAKVDSVARSTRTGGPVEVSFLMGPGAATHRFQDAVAKLTAQGAKEIVVVPLFVSSHSGHIDQVRYLAGVIDSLDSTMQHHLAMDGITRAAERVPMRVTAALDNAPELARVLADRAIALGELPASEALFLIGHGPNSAEDHASWMENLRNVADSVQKWTGFKDVKVGLVRDDAPPAVRAEAVRQIRETIALQSAWTGKPVIVVPILVSSGSVSTAKIPADIADLAVKYNAVPLLPHAAMARWVENRVKSASSLPASVTSSRASATPLGHVVH